jgi:hypothetical protein
MSPSLAFPFRKVFEACAELGGTPAAGGRHVQGARGSTRRAVLSILFGLTVDSSDLFRPLQSSLFAAA